MSIETFLRSKSIEDFLLTFIMAVEMLAFLAKSDLNSSLTSVTLTWFSVKYSDIRDSIASQSVGASTSADRLLYIEKLLSLGFSLLPTSEK